MVPARETARECARTVAIAVEDRRGDATQFFHDVHHGSLVLPAGTHVCAFCLPLLLETLVLEVPLNNENKAAELDSSARI